VSFYSQPGWTSGVFDGMKYRYLSIKPSESDKPVILFLHGFPSGTLGFKSLIPLLVAQGYGAIAPELLGYGETDKPSDIAAYSRKKICASLAGILDKEGVAKAVIFGHDHGSPVASIFTKLHPERTIALVLAAVGYYPSRGLGFNVDAIHAAVGPILKYENFGYWEFFLRSPESAKIIEDHLESFVSIMYSPPEVWKTHFCPTGVLEKNLKENYVGQTAPWYSETDKEEFTKFIKETGLSGPLHWYLAAVSDVNAEEKNLDARLTIPYLFLAAQHDAACPPILASQQGALCDDLTVKSFETGHWVIEEDPKGVADAVVEWFKSKNI